MTAGAVIPLSFAFVGDNVAFEERQPVLGRFISGTLLGATFGPLVGGTFSDQLLHAGFFFGHSVQRGRDGPDVRIGNHHNAVPVADKKIAGIDRDAADGDRQTDGPRSVLEG